MATISIGEVNRKRLLSIASDLKKTGKRVDFDEVISHVTEACESKQPRQVLWDLFTQPLRGVHFKDLHREMLKERKRDDKQSSYT